MPSPKKKVKRANGPLTETHQDLLREWHYQKNNELEYDPHELTYGTHKKVWWRCLARGHIWQAEISSRTRNNRGCPYCSNQKVCEDNCLTNNDSHEVCDEWNWEKNSDLTPNDVTPKSHKKVWWKCRKNKEHEWQARIHDRSNGNGCPYCVNRKIYDDNCLANTVIFKYGLNWTNVLCEEWHNEKNNGLTPYNVSKSSFQKVWWKCKTCNEEWLAVISDRSKGTGCPKCKNVKDSNRLSSHDRYGICEEWHHEKNNSLTPDDVSYGSGQKVWWKCKTCNGEWQATVSSRSKGTGCPHCYNEKMSKKTKLN